jgi:magnesium-transporting ATPase (P-type)
MVRIRNYNHLKLINKFSKKKKKDQEFADALEKREAKTLIVTLSLRRHLKDANEKHVQVTKDFISFLDANFPKFSSLLEEFEAKKAPKKKKEDLMRLSMDDRLPPTGLYYDIDPLALEKIFTVDPKLGLASSEVSRRKARYGPNKIPEAPPTSPVKIFLSQLLDFMVIILLVVTIVSFALQDFIEGCVLFLVVFTNVMIGFIQEWKAEKALRALKLLTVQTAQVRRNNETVTLEASELGIQRK